MASKVVIPTILTAEDFDGSIFIYAGDDVQIYREDTRVLLTTVTTDSNGKFPDTTVSLNPGSAVVIAIEPRRGIPGCGLVYTVAL